MPVNTAITHDSNYMRVLNDGIVSMQCAENILVIKTIAGMAMAVGAAIDAIEINEIVGCIAGDDTIFLAITSKENAKKVKGIITEIIA